MGSLHDDGQQGSTSIDYLDGFMIPSPPPQKGPKPLCKYSIYSPAVSLVLKQIEGLVSVTCKGPVPLPPTEVGGSLFSLHCLTGYCCSSVCG